MEKIVSANGKSFMIVNAGRHGGLGVAIAHHQNLLVVSIQTPNLD
jgi:hypothetical protein